MAWSRPVTVSVLAGVLLLGAGAARAADDPGVIRLEMRVGEDAVDQRRAHPGLPLRRRQPGQAGVRRERSRDEGSARRVDALLLPGRRSRSGRSSASSCGTAPPGPGGDSVAVRRRKVGIGWRTGSGSAAPSTSPTARALRSRRPRTWRADSDATLVLLHADEMPGVSDIPPPASVVAATRAENQAQLAGWQAEAASSLGRAVEARTFPGPAAPAIARTAGEERLDLLVTGTHGRRGFRHLVLGSVAERLVHLAPCPVLVVRRS